AGALRDPRAVSARPRGWIERGSRARDARCCRSATSVIKFSAETSPELAFEPRDLVTGKGAGVLLFLPGLVFLFVLFALVPPVAVIAARRRIFAVGVVTSTAKAIRGSAAGVVGERLRHRNDIDSQVSDSGHGSSLSLDLACLDRKLPRESSV